MTASVSRRAFIARSGALAGSLALSGPLIALSQRIAAGEPLDSAGYGSLVNMGDLWLPPGFTYSIVSRSGDPMSNGDPTPTRFDGMAAFEGPANTTILMRNHENKARIEQPVLGETDVIAPTRYDANPPYNGGVTRLVVKNDRVLEDRAVLAGTTHNCAGGTTPWGSWITCEEFFENGPAPQLVRHGYIFEVGALEDNPSAATPIVSAGRFEHEAVSWADGNLYETEDKPGASFYRFAPNQAPQAAGDLATSGGKLQALVVKDHFALDTRLADSWPGGVGASLPVEWVDLPTPDAPTDSGNRSVRAQAQSRGAAIFARTEGCWANDGKVYFDCTTGGSPALPPRGYGQIFELDVRENTLRLIFESKDSAQLLRPDNLVGSPSGEILLCEDNVGAFDDVDPPNFIRGLTGEGTVYPFARAETNPSEFCGACFDPKGHVLYVNQQGRRETETQAGFPAVTYAIKGPWKRQGTPSPGPPTPTSSPEGDPP